ncbi:MAG: EthD family reductase [Marmoricola sp.]
MHRVTIQYAVPEDPDAFDEHYFGQHVAFVAPVPGLQAFTWSKPRPLGGPPKVYLVAQLDFEDAAAMSTALASPEMQAAGADAAQLGVPMTMFSGEVVQPALG